MAYTADLLWVLGLDRHFVEYPRWAEHIQKTNSNQQDENTPIQPITKELFQAYLRSLKEVKNDKM